jgi:hypothetical protein
MYRRHSGKKDRKNHTDNIVEQVLLFVHIRIPAMVIERINPTFSRAGIGWNTWPVKHRKINRERHKEGDEQCNGQGFPKGSHLQKPSS